MPRRHLIVVGAVTLAGLSGCAGSDRESTTSPGAAATDTARSSTTVASSAAPATSALSPDTTTTTTASTTTTTTTTTTVSPTPEARASELCSYEASYVIGQLASADLDETSGLAASRRHRDVIWAHNDGNERPGVHAVARDGADLGFHTIEVGGAVDVEDIAILSGSDRDELLLADIGDNGAARPVMRLYRFAEPDPTAPGAITDVDVLEYTYPDRPHNAEVLLVDELNQRIVIVTKEQRRIAGVPPELGPTEPSFVFEGPLETGARRPTELTLVGTLDAPGLASRAVTDNPVSLLGIGGLPTGGDVSADGQLVAVRTYETVWIWPRSGGRSVAESLMSEPCQARMANESQGEAIAFFEGTVITTSEGLNPYLFQLRP